MCALLCAGVTCAGAQESSGRPAGTGTRAQSGGNAYGEYRVGVDDVLDINVIKPEVMSSTVAVAPDGAITFPYIGNVLAEGLTLPEIQEAIQRELAEGYMEYPVVSVSLRESRSRKFTIYGQVMKPGAYPVEANMTMLRAITVAGGFIHPGSTGTIKLLRPKKASTDFTVIKSDVSSILDGRDADVKVQAGDTIVVSMDKFFVYGQVVRPGAYPVEEHMTLMHAITVANGFVESGSTGRVKLFRPSTTGATSKIIESDIADILQGKDRNVFVEAGDTIVVSVDKYYVSGKVVRPGAYPVEEHMTLLHAITVAGGFSDPATTGEVKLLRPTEEKEASVNKSFKL